MAKTLFVRVNPRTGQQSFHRCAIHFTQAWQKLEEVDDATAARLEAEQMLEVSETKPEGFADAPNAADPAGEGEGSGGGSASANQVPADPAERLAVIRAAIAQLDKDDAALWTGAGKAKTEAIAAITGWPVSAAERDAASAAEEQ